MSQRGQCICGHWKYLHTPKCTANTPHPWRAACPCRGYVGSHPDEAEGEK